LAVHLPPSLLVLGPKLPLMILRLFLYTWTVAHT
jgi:hypothetical protein